MSEELRVWCGRVAAAADEVLEALAAPEPRRPSRRPYVAHNPEVGAWLSRLGGDLRHLGALGTDPGGAGERAEDDPDDD